MSRPHPRPSLRPAPTTLAGWLALALVLALTGAGGATAGALVTGAQIKNGTVTGKDVKNRSLKVKDLSKSSVKRLRGKDGRDGASAYAPPPPGTMLTGGGILSGWADSENDTVLAYAALPATLGVALDDFAPGRTLYGGPHAAFPAGDESASACAGSHTAPTATPGTLCVYVADNDNTIPGQTRLKAGSAFGADGAERNGFSVSTLADGAGAVTVRFVWAYVAP